MPKSALVTEESDLEVRFSGAVEETSQQLDDEDFNADYGFHSEWDEEVIDKEELETVRITRDVDLTAELASLGERYRLSGHGAFK